MGRSWGVLFLISLAAAVPLEPPKTFQEAVSRAIEFYNQGPNIQNTFRLLQATPLPGLNSNSLTLQQLNFTIQETVCPASEKRAPEQCEFKPDGLVKDCSGYFSTEQANPLTVITCDAGVQKPVRVTRFRAFGALLRGIGRGFRLFGSNE